MDPLLTAATAIITLLGAWFAVDKFIRPVLKTIKTLMERTAAFLEDWNGTDAEPGRDKVPGVMERLNRIDGELSHNGGTSIKDGVARIEKRLEAGDKKFDDLYKRIKRIEDRLDK
jgi:hypothetical protein